MQQHDQNKYVTQHTFTVVIRKTVTDVSWCQSKVSIVQEDPEKHQIRAHSPPIMPCLSFISMKMISSPYLYALKWISCVKSQAISVMINVKTFQSIHFKMKEPAPYAWFIPIFNN